MLLIQGVGVVGEGWRPQVDGLSSRFDLVTFDNRGIGASESGAGPLTIEGMARDALALMDALGIERFHAAGHSMGGVIAQQLALSSPLRVKSLAFLCTFSRGRQAARLTPDILAAGLRTRIGSRRMRRNAFLELVMPPSFLGDHDRDKLAEELRALFGHDLADQPPVVMQQLRAMARYDAMPRLAELSSIPVLVVSATHDRIALPRYGRELTDAIGGAHFVEIPDAGHGVTIQRAEEVNALLGQHFDAAEQRSR